LRRDEKEITARREIDEVIRGAQVCHLGLAVDGEPYVVPMSFGYDGIAVYFHTAQEGRKIDMIASNPRVCVEFERHVELVTSDTKACKWTFSYESVVAYGDIEELSSPKDRARGLNQIMRQYSGRDWKFDEPVFAKTRIWMVTLREISGKRSVRKAT
jgi:nitroimidazol reductase NimA-like FMN-containing flavoprotein (pyridoxamine 5'-phosphate oxidase superfamily)